MLPPLFLSVRVPTHLARLWRSYFGEKSKSGLPRRGRLFIIIFRLDAMGDVVMTTPLFRELKRAFPNSHCTVVVQNAYRPLLVTNPHLDEELATLLCLLTNATERVGYTEKASPQKQQLNRGFDAAFSLCLSAGPVQHEVVRNLAIVEALGGAVQDSSLEVRLTERDREFASRLLANVPASTNVIALGIGAHGTSRRWPLERYAAFVSRLGRVQPVILCSAGEREHAMRLAKLLNCETIIVSGAPLREACAVLERCDLFIGNDSGSAHLAAAMDCKTIVISRHPRGGNPNHRNSPLRFAPYCKQARVLQPATGLDSCTGGCRSLEPHCITAVSVDEVVAAALEMLANNPEGANVECPEASRRLHKHRELPVTTVALTARSGHVPASGTKQFVSGL